jgi:transposase InsO family protein
MIALPERQELVEWIRQAHCAGARLCTACEEAGVSVRTFQRWHELDELGEDGRSSAVRPPPAHALSALERAQVLSACHEPRFADLPPSQIVPRLADEGVYLASESSFYRILHDAKEQHHRGRARAPSKTQPQRHVAEGPNAVWCWDVTYLPSQVRGLFFFLFAVIDLFSRKLVAWEVHDRESGEEAALLIERACWREHIAGRPLVLHADNGAAQKAFTLKAKLEALGVVPSHSRPGVSDDNPFIESWFRTLKYVPAYPTQGFESIAAARQWVHRLVTWYNTEHRHSAVGFVTPEERHTGKAAAIFEQRRQVYAAARDRNPQRWSGNIRAWHAPDRVWLNPPGTPDKATATQ